MAEETVGQEDAASKSGSEGERERARGREMERASNEWGRDIDGETG